MRKSTKENQSGVFLDSASLRPEELSLAPLDRVLSELKFYDQTDPSVVLERIKSASIVICNKTLLAREIITQAKNLELIAVAATGVNNIDLDAARECGVVVCNARGYSTPSVVQLTFTLILSLMTKLVDYDKAISSGAWQTSKHYCLLNFPFSELAGKKIGIIGYGDIGKAVARAAEGFCMVPLISERKGVTEVRENRLLFEELLVQADIISVHCPLVAETENLIAEQEISLMKKGSFLINVSRGGVVNEGALRDALKQGHIAGAGVDVLTNEPPKDGNPLLDPRIPNLIITPHIAWASREARQRLIEQIAENIKCFLAGVPKNIVN